VVQQGLMILREEERIDLDTFASQRFGQHHRLRWPAAPVLGSAPAARACFRESPTAFDCAARSISRWVQRHAPPEPQAYSITSSASARSDGGTSRPSALGSFEIDDEVEFAGLKHRHLRGLLPF